MPELPEVEITRRSFADAIKNARILSVRMGKALRWPLGCLPETLVGRSVVTISRRGKYLLMELSEGFLLLHLGMSGSLRFAQTLPDAGVHDHFEMVTAQGTLRLNDPRRFGAVIYVPNLQDAGAVKLLGHLGVEPLSDAFTLEMFSAGLKQRKSTIKQVLLAGDLVVGVGNIYASEALFLAGIRPVAPAASLSKPRVRRLHQAIGTVLQRALDRGGSTLRNFSSATGDAGHFQLETMVYGRDGLPCRVCSRTVQMLRQGQRSSFYCPICQKK